MEVDQTEVMSKKVGQILKRFASAKEIWSSYHTVWDDCYTYAMPGRVGFTQRTPEDNFNMLFDMTAVDALPEFASQLQSFLIPPNQKWIELRSGTNIPPELKQDIDKRLSEITDIFFDILHNRSNFDNQSYESMLDVAVGTAVMAVDRGTPERPFHFTAIPQTEIILESGPFGYVDRFYRNHSVEAHLIEVIWPNADISDELRDIIRESPDKKQEILEVIDRNYSVRGTETFDRTLIWTKEKHILEETVYSGEGANPLVAFRWSVSGRSAYGSGPLFNALPAIRVLNLAQQFLLEGAEISIGGMWQYDDDGTVNPDTIQLVPRELIPRAPGSRGLEPLQSAQNINIAELTISELKKEIRKSLFDNFLGAPEGTPMSAFEASQRTKDHLRRQSSPFGRIQTEGVQRIVKRCLFILKEMGMIDFPVIDGRAIKIIPTSPLARLTNQETIGNIDRFMQLTSQYLGPEATNAIVDQFAFADKLADLLDVPHEIIRSGEQRQQIIAAAQQAAQQQLGGQLPQGQPQQGQPQQIAGPNGG